jgi:hypothetical protein
MVAMERQLVGGIAILPREIDLDTPAVYDEKDL